jgi:hypothetical protein
MRADAIQIPPQLRDAISDPPAVHFQLGFAGPSCPDSAAQAGEHYALSRKPGKQIAQLRKLNLELSFTRARAPGKYIQDELGSIQHLTVDFVFEIALLPGRELVIKNQ